MGKTLLDIRVKYGTLSKSEKKIADFLLDGDGGEMPIYITDFARRCGTSEATVVRFAKRLGFEGFQQLKIAMAQQTESRPINADITFDDSAADVFAKVAADAAHKLFRLGIKAHAYTDNHMQAIAAAHACDKSAAIGISHSGASKDIVSALRLAKENGAVTIALTHLGKSPIGKVSDIILSTVSDETNYRILGLSSRIAQLTIVDAIYSYLVCHMPDAARSIAVTEDALRDKKI